MSHKFIGEHGKRYAYCAVCEKVLKWGERARTSGQYNKPFEHCGKLATFITDERAHEILKGRPRRSPASRLKRTVARRGSYSERFGARP